MTINLDANTKKSLLLFGGFLLFALCCMLYGQQVSKTQPNIRVWDLPGWLSLFAGLPFILLQEQAGLPQPMAQSVSNRNRFLIPLLTGIIFAILDVIVIRIILHPQPYDRLPPFLQPFPYSILLYGSGAIDIEIFYRLIPITLVLIIARKLKASPNVYVTVFWVIAVLSSLREPIEQWVSEPLWVTIYSFISGFAMNLLQAHYFYKSGFLASLFTRFGHYAVWHILLGIYVQFFELGGL